MSSLDVECETDGMVVVVVVVVRWVMLKPVLGPRRDDGEYFVTRPSFNLYDGGIKREFCKMF